MPKLREAPVRVAAVGEPPKLIDELFGRASSGHGEISIAHMRSPAGWSEPGQTPEFRELTVVLNGTLRVEFKGGVIEVGADQALETEPGEWIRYSTPHAGGAEYIAVCLPAFTPDTVHRDE